MPPQLEQIAMRQSGFVLALWAGIGVAIAALLPFIYNVQANGTPAATGYVINTGDRFISLLFGLLLAGLALWTRYRPAFRRPIAIASLVVSLLGNAQAFSALSASPGACAFYDQQRASGHGHNDTLRRLANRLVRILHGCLKTRTLYDEDTAWVTASKTSKPLDKLAPGMSNGPREYRAVLDQRADRGGPGGSDELRLA